MGSLTSNAAWAWIGDRFGELRLLESVGLLRLGPPLAMLLLLNADGLAPDIRLAAFALVFVLIGALINGMTIGYLMEISPDDRRPAYSAYCNALASPAALLPLLGAAAAEMLSLEMVFVLAIAASAPQLGRLRMLRVAEGPGCE